MTWSVVARDPASGVFGVAVTTKFFAVGALATQALVDPELGPRGPRLLAEGRLARDVLSILLADHCGRASRRPHVIDRTGGVAAHTGQECVEWCGHGLDRDFYQHFLPSPAHAAGIHDRAVIEAELPRLKGALEE